MYLLPIVRPIRFVFLEYHMKHKQFYVYMYNVALPGGMITNACNVIGCLSVKMGLPCKTACCLFFSQNSGRRTGQINHSLHLAWNYAPIFVRGHYPSTVSFEKQIMSKDKYASIFSFQVDMWGFVNWGILLRYSQFC